MSLLDEVREAQRQHRGARGCRLAQAMAEMVDDDRLDLESALADLSIFATTITTVMRAHGFQFGKDVVSDHRTGRCTCGRD